MAGAEGASGLPSVSPVKRSSRTPKLSAKMIALEEEFNQRRRKNTESAQGRIISHSATHHLQSSAIVAASAAAAHNVIAASLSRQPKSAKSKSGGTGKAAGSVTSRNRKSKSVSSTSVCGSRKTHTGSHSSSSVLLKSEPVINGADADGTTTICKGGTAQLYEECASELDISGSQLLMDDSSEDMTSFTTRFNPITSSPINTSAAQLSNETNPQSEHQTVNSLGQSSEKKRKVLNSSVSSGSKKHEHSLNKSENEAEEKWLMAIEAGKLEEDAELRSMKDPALMTARQRAVIEAKQARVEHMQHIQALHDAWRGQLEAEEMSDDMRAKRAQKAARRRRLAEEKRDKEKKDTIKRLLKKSDSRVKAKKLLKNKTQPVAKILYRWTYSGATVSFPSETPPESFGIDLTPRIAGQYPTPVLCSSPGCANIKRYQCSSNGLPVCSLQCYRQVSLLPPLAQLIESVQNGATAAAAELTSASSPANDGNLTDSIESSIVRASPQDCRTPATEECHASSESSNDIMSAAASAILAVTHV